MLPAPALFVAASLVLLQDAGGASGTPSGLPPHESAPERADAVDAAKRDEVPLGMPWQRSLEDALAVSKATGKPLLVCVNVDGESASDAIARGRYHDPRFLALVDGFVPILASPIRHNPVDHTAGGRRILDPRFGRLVESEHIDHEPLLYARYFGGQRVAPRHVGVSPDGEILFDLYLLNDLSAIDRALKEHGKFDVPRLDPSAMSTEQLLASPDAAAREALERAFVEGSPETCRALVAAAFSARRETQHPELARLALYGADESVRLAGARAVAQHPEPAREFLARAFMVAAVSPDLRVSLAEAAALLATSSNGELAKRGLRLAGIFAGLGTPSELDIEAWTRALAGTEAAPEETDLDTISAALERVDRALATTPLDPDLGLEDARLSLALAKVYLAQGGGNPSFPLQDARDAAERVRVARPDPVAAAVIARAAWLMGDQELALRMAREALPLLPALPGLAESELSRDALDVLIQVEVRGVYGAIEAEQAIAPESVRDAVAAYRALAEHPLASAEELDAGLVFLETIEAFAEQGPLARIGVLRFPEVGRMHQWLRYCVQRDEGVDALARIYLDLPAPAGFETDFLWHAALSQMIAGETLGRDGRIEEAVATYRRSLANFERTIERAPEYAASSDHYRVLGHGGLAYVFLGTGELDAAMEELRAAALLLPSSFAEKDSLGHMPRETVGELQAALRRAGRSQDARELEADLVRAGVRL